MTVDMVGIVGKTAVQRSESEQLKTNFAYIVAGSRREG